MDKTCWVPLVKRTGVKVLIKKYCRQMSFVVMSSSCSYYANIYFINLLCFLIFPNNQLFNFHVNEFGTQCIYNLYLITENY